MNKSEVFTLEEIYHCSYLESMLLNIFVNVLENNELQGYEVCW